MKIRMCTIAVTLTIVTLALTSCVKIVKIGEEGKLTGEIEFNAGDSVAEIWETAVLPELLAKAVSLSDFLTEANGDLKSLADKYGKYSMGTSGEISYVVKGTAVVLEVNQEKKAGYITLKLLDYAGGETIKIQIGSVYKGSSVRDSLDIMKFGDFKNQQQWAAVSQSLHDVIDEKVIKAADPSSLLGKQIEFVGTFTVIDNQELLITPVELTVK